MSKAQAAVMVGVAAVLLLGAVGLLGWTVSWQSAQADRYVHDRSMQEQIAVLTKSAQDSGLCLVKYSALGDPKFLREFDRHNDDASRAVEILQREATPEEKPKIDIVVADYLDIKNLGDKAKFDTPSKPQLSALVSRLQLDGQSIDNELVLTTTIESPKVLSNVTRQVAMLAYGAAFLAFLILAFTAFKAFRSNPPGGV